MWWVVNRVNLTLICKIYTRKAHVGDMDKQCLRGNKCKMIIQRDNPADNPFKKIEYEINA